MSDDLSGDMTAEPTAESTAGNSERLAALQRRRSGSAVSRKDRLSPGPQYRGLPNISWWRNPTMWLVLVSLAGWSVGWIGYLIGLTPWWLAIGANAVANYVGFTVFHESVHRAAHPNRRINDAIGWLPAAMLTFTYPVFRACHLNHHAHTNDHERDPDHWVANEPRALLPWWLIGTAVNYRRLCYRHGWASARARRAQKLMDAVLVVGTVGAALTGNLVAALVVFWVPGVLAGMVLFYAFDYLPHYPFDSTERFHDTRAQPGRVRHALLLGQNYHVIHHLWVSVPWFYYRRVFDELEPQLRERGVRID